MRILLDTHIFIWWLGNNPHLPKKARSLIIDADAAYISSVSIWEAAIKIRLGKLKANINDLVKSIESEGFIELPLTAEHAAIVQTLPDHHRDPFDRALVAQAIREPLRLLTVDEALAPYSELVQMIR